jgi:hypothetical protein
MPEQLAQMICTCTEWWSKDAVDHDPYTCELLYVDDYLHGDLYWDGQACELRPVVFEAVDELGFADEDQRLPAVDMVLDAEDILRVVLTDMHKGNQPTDTQYDKALNLIGADVVAVMEKLSDRCPLELVDVDVIETFAKALHVLGPDDAPPLYDCMCQGNTHVLCGACGVYRPAKDDPYWVPTYDRRKRELRMFLEGKLYGCTCKAKKVYACIGCNVQRWHQNGAWSYWSKQNQNEKTYLSSEGKQFQQTKKSTVVSGNSEWDYWGGGSTVSTYQKCRHYGVTVALPDGTNIMCSSEHTPDKREVPAPDFGCYMASSWEPDWKAYWLNWTDMGLPKMSMKTVDSIVDELLERARAGQVVEIGCIGGHGRTGTLLAMLALKAGADDATIAKNWVWEKYCTHAIEGKKQEWYLDCYDAALKGLDAPPMPVEPCSFYKHKTLFEKGEQCPINCEYAEKDFTKWTEDEAKKKHSPKAITPAKGATSKKVTPVGGGSGGSSSEAYPLTYNDPITWDTPIPERGTVMCSTRRHRVLWWRHEECDVENCKFWKPDEKTFVSTKCERAKLGEVIDRMLNDEDLPQEARIGQVIDLVSGKHKTDADPTSAEEQTPETADAACSTNNHGGKK